MAVVLHHLCDLSVEQVASETGAPVGTVKARLSRGRAALARHLATDEAEEKPGRRAAVSDELTGALRALAARYETPPPLPAVEVRNRARRRSRRRRATLALGTAATAACAVAVVTLALHPDHAVGKRHRPGATPATSPTTARPPAPPPRPARPARPAASTCACAPSPSPTACCASTCAPPRRFPPGTRLTVVARSAGAVLPLRTRTEVRQVKVPYLVELRTPTASTSTRAPSPSTPRCCGPSRATRAGWASARRTPNGCTTGSATATRSRRRPHAEPALRCAQLTSPRRYA